MVNPRPWTMSDMHTTLPDTQKLKTSVQDALSQLDGTLESEVALLTGLSAAELKDLGGVGPETA